MFLTCFESFNFKLLFDKIKRGKNFNFVDKENQTLLTAAASLGFDYFIKYFVSKGADINFSPPQGNNPIESAIINSKFSTFKLLIELGCDINYKNENGLTLIHTSAQSSNVDIIKYLIEEKNFDINLKNERNEYSPLLYAIIHNNYHVVEYLLSKGADYNQICNNLENPFQTAINKADFNILYLFKDLTIDYFPEVILFQAIQTLDENKIKFVIDKVVKNGRKELLNDIDSVLYAIINNLSYSINYLIDNDYFDVNQRDSTGLSALALSSICENTSLIKKLLSKNAIIKTNDLEIVISARKWKIVSLLVDHVSYISEENISLIYGPIYFKQTVLAKKILEKIKIDVNFSKNGEAPIFACIKTKNYEMAKLLIERGADLEITGDNNATPLQVCCIYNSHEILQLLIENHAKLNVIYENEYTPLMVCALSNAYNCIEVLANNKVNLEEKDENGLSAFFIACKNKSIGVMKKLLKYGANINTKSNKGATPLMVAAYANDTNICCYLLKNGADAKIVNDSGKSVLDFINMNKNTEMLGCLLKYRPNDAKVLLPGNFEEINYHYKDFKPQSLKIYDEKEMGEETKLPDVPEVSQIEIGSPVSKFNPDYFK
ncbi:hypothetical protein TVAG_012500 [Trichomonas vaginalis G3]|uniref:Uncharacterized protein n=1 Tax=Trichomonas vaginalis (strain ATCC PRA-98 / G3) TaxID=412133 RepID=A2E900_TRIV3|nr:spectrin binding [Trichomonas vaginalis G3]EAY10884.1 hypothetical protein TVAG_012500 [Trichomonas vaginalis G3]KAI5482931.1 spectrin binding [Trichomonas vaginalis G3]|eukprot:XP_001323107.1 hypothetical protein [Trichomonas vaginalis G3]